MGISRFTEVESSTPPLRPCDNGGDMWLELLGGRECWGTGQGAGTGREDLLLSPADKGVGRAQLLLPHSK